MCMGLKPITRNTLNPALSNRTNRVANNNMQARDITEPDDDSFPS